MGVFSYMELSLLSEYYGSDWMSIVVNVTMFIGNLATQIWVLLIKGLGHVSTRVSVYINLFINEEKVLKAWFVNTIVHSLCCLCWIICCILVSDLKCSLMEFVLCPYMSAGLFYTSSEDRLVLLVLGLPCVPVKCLQTFYVIIF